MLKPKILLFNNSSASFDAHRRPIYERLQSMNCETFILLPESQTFKKDNTPKKLILCPFGRKNILPTVELFSIFKIFKIIKSIQPDIIHNFTIKPVLWGTLASRIVGTPIIINTITGLGYVFTSKDILAKILKPILEMAYRLILNHKNVKVIFQNPDDLNYFIKNKLVDQSQCYLIMGSGVDIKKFSPKVNTNIVPVVTFVGRLLKEKGLEDLVLAVQILNKEGLSFLVKIVGGVDPENRGSISKDQLSEWSQIPNLEVNGPTNDISAVLHISDIFCLPSYREGVPMATLEAMACGLPIVTTDAPGTKETVCNGVNGILVPIQEPIFLAKALAELIVSKKKRLSFGKESREMAEKLFSKEKIVDQILDLYEITRRPV